MLGVEGQAIHKGRRQEEHEDGSEGSTALVSTPAMRGPWSRTNSHMSKDLYPAEHPFIRNLKDPNNEDETPYAATTEGFPLYKGSYVTHCNEAPPGFKHNNGDHFIAFPIKGLDGDVRQAEYVQVILHPNPIIIGLCNDSDKVLQFRTRSLLLLPISDLITSYPSRFIFLPYDIISTSL